MSSLRLFAAGLALAAPLTLRADPYVSTTFAGMPAHGFADGPGASARFHLPQAIAIAPNGDLYVSDFRNDLIRKVTPNGTVSTFAGKLRRGGYQDGPVADALFGNIFGIAVGSTGVVFVADAYANSVRAITSTGVTTVVGSAGKAGSTDGLSTDALLSNPRGIAVDRAGNGYIADTSNGTIRKVSTSGMVTTLAGTAGQFGSVDGTGSAARFRAPYGIAVDGSGNVYVADWEDSTIRKITPGGVVTTLAGSSRMSDSVDGTGAQARFDTPSALAVDASGNVYVTDALAHVVRKISPAGNVTTVAGSAYESGARNDTGAYARFNRPMGIVVDASGNLYVCEASNSAIRKITPGGAVTTLAGQPGVGDADGLRGGARFFNPGGTAFDAAGNLYVADTYNHTIRKVAPDGRVTTIAGGVGQAGSIDGTATGARFAFPTGVAVDANGTIFVADYGNGSIRKITTAGLVGTFAGLSRSYGTTDGQGQAARFESPRDLKFDAAGNLYVTDDYSDTIRKITPDGSVTTYAGRAGMTGDTDGPAAQARFNTPRGLTIDAAGNMFIADSGNQVIRKITPEGMVTTIAGRSGERGSANGSGANARFNLPIGIAADAAGNVYVGDTGNFAIRRISPSGQVTTIAGSGLNGYSDGVADWIEFTYPGMLLCDAVGNLYVSDVFSCAIRKVSEARVAVASSRLANLSIRANLLANERLMTGFVVSGAAKPILVRGVGPGIAAFVGGAQVASDPRLEMYDSTLTMVQTNENWGGGSLLADTFASVGAFPLEASSKDAALVRSIAGSMTAHVLTPASGLAIVEAYDTVSSTTDRLVNLSARYMVSPGTGSIIAGFVIVGSHHKTLLIRGVGPTLASFGVGSALSDPKIELYDENDAKIAENNDWLPTLATTFSTVGAFDLVNYSKDAALLISLPPGRYTAQLSGAGTGSGEALVEIYEVGN